MISRDIGPTVCENKYVLRRYFKLATDGTVYECRVGVHSHRRVAATKKRRAAMSILWRWRHCGSEPREDGVFGAM